MYSYSCNLRTNGLPAYIFVYRLRTISMSLYLRSRRALLKFELLRVQPYDSLITGEVQKQRPAQEVTDTSATLANLVHDVMDTDCQTQNGKDFGSVFATFKRGILPNKT